MESVTEHILATDPTDVPRARNRSSDPKLNRMAPRASPASTIDPPRVCPWYDVQKDPMHLELPTALSIRQLPGSRNRLMGYILLCSAVLRLRWYIDNWRGELQGSLPGPRYRYGLRQNPFAFRSSKTRALGSGSWTWKTARTVAFRLLHRLH
jgi:hypothetical protein